MIKQVVTLVTAAMLLLTLGACSSQATPEEAPMSCAEFNQRVIRVLGEVTELTEEGNDVLADLVDNFGILTESEKLRKIDNIVALLDETTDTAWEVAEINVASPRVAGLALSFALHLTEYSEEQAKSLLAYTRGEPTSRFPSHDEVTKSSELLRLGSVRCAEQAT